MGWSPSVLATPQARRWGNGMYLARKAERRARQLSRKPRVARRLVPGTPVWELALQHLRCRLSPAQTASTLAAMPVPVRISYGTIHNALYAMPRGELRAEVLRRLRRKHPHRQARPKYNQTCCTSTENPPRFLRFAAE